MLNQQHTTHKPSFNSGKLLKPFSSKLGLPRIALLVGVLAILTVCLLPQSLMAIAQPTYAQSPTSSEEINPVDEPLTKEDLNALNPLKQNGDPDVNSQLLNSDGSLNPAGVINRALTFIFPLAGLILFVMLVWGGFEMLTGAASKKSLDAGKQRVVAALIGFLLLFASYWLIQIVETITKVDILGLS